MINQAKKMNLDDLKIESFVTTNDNNLDTIKGGYVSFSVCANICVSNDNPHGDGCHFEETI